MPAKNSVFRKMAGAFAILALIAVGVFYVASALTDTTASNDNSFEAGFLEISDNDLVQAMFEVENMEGAQSEVRCLVLKNTGSIDIDNLRFYAPAGTGDAGDYIHMNVSKGTGGSAFSNVTGDDSSCDGFVEDAEVYDGLLADMPTDNASGIDHLANIGADPTPAHDGDTITYRFEATLVSTQDAQSRSIQDQSFVWDATGVEG